MMATRCCVSQKRGDALELRDAVLLEFERERALRSAMLSAPLLRIRHCCRYAAMPCRCYYDVALTAYAMQHHHAYSRKMMPR